MKQIVECVPNFSEGRRKEVIDQILAAITAVEGVTLLDAESDPDHNRTVVTYVGEPAGVEEAAFRAIARASQLIDMDQHKGAHPRMGATDVVPFVPVRNISMQECAAMAQRLGQRVGVELGIPVYLYEAAASRPDRCNLADVRRGEYEGIKAEIATVESRRPDFGPCQMGRAGATVIGARAPLVAFNVYLNTTDVEIAKAVAKAVRHSSGGLRYAKALGILVDGRAQITMNLTDYKKTPILRVMDLIHAEAARHGCAVAESEVIGLLPAEALLDVALATLQLHRFKAEQILENRVAGM